MPKLRSPDHRTAKLLADGQKALKLRQSGTSPRDMLLVLGCSRARLYRAMAVASQQSSGDPLLS